MFLRGFWAKMLVGWRRRKGRCADIGQSPEAKHCSSLCSQSEGDEFYGKHIVKERVESGLMAFSLRVRGPHFASKVSYNAGAAIRFEI